MKYVKNQSIVTKSFFSFVSLPLALSYRTKWCDASNATRGLFDHRSKWTGNGILLCDDFVFLSIGWSLLVFLLSLHFFLVHFRTDNHRTSVTSTKTKCSQQKKAYSRSNLYMKTLNCLINWISFEMKRTHTHTRTTWKKCSNETANCFRFHSADRTWMKTDKKRT